MVKIYIDNVYSRIVGHLPDNVRKELYDAMSYKVQNAHFIPSVQNNKWDGVIRLFNTKYGQSFLTGLLGYVREVFAKHNIKYIKVDERERPEQNLKDLKFVPPEGFQSRDYQDATIERSIEFTRGVLEMATGAGKTLTVTRLISELKTGPCIFFVLTVDLLNQAHEVLSSCLNMPIGIIGDGKYDIKQINVCTVQTAVRALNFQNKNFNISDYKFDDEDGSWEEQGVESEENAKRVQRLLALTKFVYFDETHHVASKTAQEVMGACKSAYWRYGGSATPYREAGDEIMIQAVFGGKIVSIPASYLIKRGFLNKPYILVVPMDINCPYHNYPSVYKHCVTENESFHKHVADTSKHFNKRGLTSLILVQRIKHGKSVKKELDDEIQFVHGSLSSKKRKKAIQDLRDKEVMSMIATTLADEGLDIPVLNSAMMAGLGKSITRVPQRIGRIIRKDKSGISDRPIFIMYVFKGVRHLEKHAKMAIKVIKMEPEFEIVMSKGPDFVNGEIDKILGVGSSPDLFD